MQKNEQNIVANRFIVGPQIGKGSFGEVFITNLNESSEIFALKKEDGKSKSPQLLVEARLLRLLNGNRGFPRVCWYGSQNNSNYLVMEMLGPSLEDLFLLCKRKFSLKTVLLLAVQIIQRIEVLHQKNYLHRDVKPENFLIGLHQASSTLYLIDFGLSKKYCYSKTKQHQPYRENRMIVGTARYSSINTHAGIEQSRRDDLESIGYLLLYLLRGSVPWQSIKATSKSQKYRRMQQMKMNIPVEILFKGYPIQFCTYMNYCRSMKFEENPDYSFLKKLFRDLFARLGFENDNIFDWCESKELVLMKKPGLTFQLFNYNRLITEQIINRVSQSEIQQNLSLRENTQEIKQPIQMQNKEIEQKKDEQMEIDEIIEDEGENIDSDLLDETDMQLLSSRNPQKQVDND